MTTAQQKLKANIEAIADEVVEFNETGNGYTAIIKKAGKVFAFCVSGDTFSLYSCFRDGSDWKFMTGVENKKRFSAAENFIKARTN